MIWKSRSARRTGRSYSPCLPGRTIPEDSSLSFNCLAIGVPHEDFNAEADAGSIYAIRGSSTGLAGGASQMMTQGAVKGTSTGGDNFGLGLAVGDFNDDGDDDLAAGAPFDGSSDTGKVYAIHGSSSGLTSNLSTSFPFPFPVPSGPKPQVLTGSAADGHFGYALAVGDLDGDSVDDLAVGAPGTEVSNKESAGSVLTYTGDSSGLATAETWTQSGEGGTIEKNDAYGATLVAGDFDDGDDDLAVGIPGEGVSNDHNYFYRWMGSSSTVSTYREDTLADLVTLFVEKMTTACGVGGVLGDTNGSQNAFRSVSDRGCNGIQVHSHEIGHNLGMSHDPANGSGGACTDARGHFVDQGGRTIMSYWTECTNGSSSNCPVEGLFSNPDVDFSFGDPSGILGERDNARCGNLTVGAVAAYR